MALWLITRHSAFLPHFPSQGLTHFVFIQAISEGHSEFIIHSGRQAGTVPIIPGKQEQIA